VYFTTVKDLFKDANCKVLKRQMSDAKSVEAICKVWGLGDWFEEIRANFPRNSHTLYYYKSKNIVDSESNIPLDLEPSNPPREASPRLPETQHGSDYCEVRSESHLLPHLYGESRKRQREVPVPEND